MQIQLHLDHDSIGGHENLILNISFLSEPQLLDTYYFALDNSFLPNEESGKKVILSLIKNLNFWIQRTQNLENDEAVYFPIDLSDAYVGFLIVKGQDENLEIKYGVSQEVGGWGVNAYYPEEFNLKNPVEYFDEGKLVISKNDFKSDILNSIKQINKQI